MLSPQELPIAPQLQARAGPRARETAPFLLWTGPTEQRYHLARQHPSGLIGWHIPQPLAFWVELPVATYTTAALTGGWAALTDLLRRLARVKVNSLWYMVAIGLPIAMGATLVGRGAAF